MMYMTHTHSYTYHSYAHTLVYTHTHTTRAQSYSHTQGTMSPIHFARLRPRSNYDEIVLTNKPREPDDNEDTDGTVDSDDTEATMSAGEESGDEASPPDVASQVLDYDRPKRRHRRGSGAFASMVGAEQQPDEPSMNAECAIAPTNALLR